MSSRPEVVIGVDFDNTIVSYDNLFHRIAVERGLIRADVPCRKKEIRDYIRLQGGEQDWIELQGHVYGARMAEAEPFPGVIEFFNQAVRRGLPLYIISHKTARPVIGPPHDLRQAARDWLSAQGFFQPGRVGVSAENVFFGGTRQEKIDFIRQARCTHFIDDLEETFLEPSFPSGVVRILFGRKEAPPSLAGVILAKDWAEVADYVFRAVN